MLRINWKALIAVLPVLGLLLTGCAAQPQGNAGSRWDSSVDKIEATLDQALAAYERGEVDIAKQTAKDAYFEVFESSGLETAIRLRISSRRAFEVENGFGEINRSLRAGAEPSQIRQEVAETMAMIREDTARLSAGSGGGLAGGFLTSFLIVTREGFEAILIIGALIAYLVKSGNGARVRTIYQSAIAAILASIATAVIIKYLFNISGASQELLEGITMLIAVAVLFSVSFWLLGKVQAQKWQQYIQSKVSRSLSTGSTLALWSVAFLAVYREGAEIALFYLALISGSPGSQTSGIALGFAAGAVALVGIFVAIRWGSVKIPLKPFFIATGVLLYYMAFVFAGKGILELQEAGVVGATIVPDLPTIGFLGFYPTWQTIALQAALLLAAGIGLAFQFLKKTKPATSQEPTAETSQKTN